MKLVKLDRTGHTELDLAPEDMIRELETEMNRGKVAIAEVANQRPTYLRKAQDVRALPETATITVMPQLAGGCG